MHGLRHLFSYIILAAVCNPAFAQCLQFPDCSVHTLSILKHRIYVRDKKLHPVILSRDVLHLSICNGVGSGMRRSGADRGCGGYQRVEALDATGRGSALLVAENSRRGRHNSRFALNNVLTIAYFDRLSMPRLT